MAACTQPAQRPRHPPCFCFLPLRLSALHFQPVCPAGLPGTDVCALWVHLLLICLCVASASSLSACSGATRCFSTSSVNCKPVDIGKVYCSVLLPAPSSASLLQSFGGNISLIHPEEQVLNHKATLGGVLFKFFLKPSGWYQCTIT